MKICENAVNVKTKTSLTSFAYIFIVDRYGAATPRWALCLHKTRFTGWSLGSHRKGFAQSISLCFFLESFSNPDLFQDSFRFFKILGSTIRAFKMFLVTLWGLGSQLQTGRLQQKPWQRALDEKLLGSKPSFTQLWPVSFEVNLELFQL